MKKRVFIIHGWGGNPQEAWLPWLKKELEKIDFQVEVPTMPETEHPVIQTWVNYVSKLVGEVDVNTFFVGHSIGCQTIMRYLEQLPAMLPVGGVVSVAGWFTLMNLEDKEMPIAQPWLNDPIDFTKVKSHTKKFISIFSDTDDCVPIENRKLFQDRLDAKIITEHGKGHFSEGDGIFQLPSALQAVVELAN